MNYKPILKVYANRNTSVYIGIIAIIIGVVYYLESPYQNCIRSTDIEVDEVRNRIATETDVTTRMELQSEQENLFNQRWSCKGETW